MMIYTRGGRRTFPIKSGVNRRLQEETKLLLQMNQRVNLSIAQVTAFAERTGCTSTYVINPVDRRHIRPLSNMSRWLQEFWSKQARELQPLKLKPVCDPLEVALKFTIISTSLH